MKDADMDIVAIIARDKFLSANTLRPPEAELDDYERSQFVETYLETAEELEALSTAVAARLKGEEPTGAFPLELVDLLADKVRQKMKEKEEGR